MEYELIILRQLKSACGHEYNSKMFKMISDIQKGPQLTESFISQLNSPILKPNYGFSISILNSRAWTFHKLINFLKTNDTVLTENHLMPLVLHRTMAAFESYFIGKNPKKKLSWTYSLSVGELEGTFYDNTGSRTYTFVLSGIQIAIFLEIQSKKDKTIPINELLSRLKMDLSVFSENFQPLLMSSLVLQNENEELLINPKFFRYEWSLTIYSFIVVNPKKLCFFLLDLLYLMIDRYQRVDLARK